MPALNTVRFLDVLSPITSSRSVVMYKMAGQECWCSNTLTTSSSTGQAVASSQCNMPCTGNSYTTCGAGGRIWIYSSGSGPTTTATTTASTATATTTGWTKLGCYQDSNTRALSGYSTSSSSLTIASCQSTCRGKGYNFAGVEYCAYFQVRLVEPI